MGSKRACTPYLTAARSIYDAWEATFKVSKISEQLGQDPAISAIPVLRNAPAYVNATIVPKTHGSGSSGSKSSSSTSGVTSMADVVDLATLVSGRCHV